MHVAFDHFDVGVARQALGGGADHARARVDADIALGMRRDQFGQHAVARGDVQHLAGPHQGQGGARQRFPGPARRVVALHVASDRVRPVLFGCAQGQHFRQALGVLAQQGVVGAAAECVPQRAFGRRQRLVEAVVGRDAGAAVEHQLGLLELGQMGGDARLRKHRDRGQLGHGQLLALEQRQQAYSGAIREHAQAGRPGIEIHGYRFIRIQR